MTCAHGTCIEDDCWECLFAEAEHELDLDKELHPEEHAGIVDLLNEESDDPT